MTKEQLLAEMQELLDQFYNAGGSLDDAADVLQELQEEMIEP